MAQKPIAFMSYTHWDDQYEHGRLTMLRQRLSAAVQAHTGEEFRIFQDRDDIEWGQNWKERIEESLDEVTFLIPVLTPSFFKSHNCRWELERFLEREKKLSRNDLILPIYFIECIQMEEDSERSKDDLAQIFAARQYADWRNLRMESASSRRVRIALEQLAKQIRNAQRRVQSSQTTIVPGGT